MIYQRNEKTHTTLDVGDMILEGSMN